MGATTAPTAPDHGAAAPQNAAAFFADDKKLSDEDTALSDNDDRLPAKGEAELVNPSGRSSDDDDDDDDDDDNEQDGDGVGHAATRVKSTASIAETMPLWREVVFVSTICLAQLYTQAGLGQVIAIIHIIGNDFGIASAGELSWFVAGYSLTVGTFILFAGRLGDVFGYKQMFLIGMGWFAVWSMVCGLAAYSNHVLFIFGRVLQGIGPALCLPNGVAILGASYAPGRRKAMAFAAFGATAPGGAILGGVFSGLFALAWWPWTFWCCALVLAATTVLGYYVIPHIPPHVDELAGGVDARTWRGRLAQLDVLGAVAGVVGLVLFNFAWNQAPIVGWGTPYVYVTLILGVLCIAAFFVYEMRYAVAPLLPFHALSADVSFVLGAVACGWGCFGIWFWYIWQFLQELRGATPLLAVAMVCPVAISGFAAAIVTGALIHRIGPAWTMTAALTAFLVGTILLATAPVRQSYWAQTFVCVLIQPWGMDMSFPAATLILSNAVERRHQGIAASLVSTVVNYSIALGLGFAGTAEYSVTRGDTSPEGLLRGYRTAFYVAIGLAGLGLIICLAFLFREKRKEKRTDASEKA